MKNLSSNWAEAVINHRFFCIVLLVCILGLSIFSIIKYPLKYDNSFEMFMLKDDPNIVKFENFRNLFGDAEYLSIGISARPGDPDVFVSQTIQIIAAISTMLEEHEFVTKVSSLSNYQYTHNSDGVVTTDDLFDSPSSLEHNSSQLNLARKVMAKETLAHDWIITKDLQHTRILVRTEYIRGENSHKVRVSNDIYEFLSENNYQIDGYKIRLSGGAIIAERFEYLSKRDSAILNPLVAGIMSLIIYFLYGSFFVCFLPWFLIGANTALVAGLQAWLEFPKTVVNAALIPTLMIIGMGVSVHVLSEFLRLRKEGNCSKTSSKQTIKNLLTPIFFTAVTTSIGFTALAITNLIPVKQYALLAAFGSLTTFLISMTLFVSLLSFLRVPLEQKGPTKLKNFVVSITKILANFTYKNNVIIMLLAFCSIIFCLFTLPRISVDSNIFNYFKSNNWVNQDMEYFDQIYKISGIEIVLDSGKEDGIKEPQFLRTVEQLESYLNGLEKTGKVNSIIEFLKQLRQSLNDNDTDFFILPDSSQMTAQLLLMYENSGPDDDLSDSVDFDKRYLRVTVPVENSSAKEFSEFFELLQTNLDQKFPRLNIDYTGPMVLYNAQEMYINSGLKKSFALALTMIGLSFFVLFGSLKYGCLTLFPSVLPILFAGGLTVFMGISLDLGTIIVGAMCMGIAVDDAIHVMARYIKYKSANLTTHKSVDLALRESGKAVIFTSLILVFGFSSMVFASLVPTVLFGVFAGLIMALALLGDLLVLPALLFIFDKD